MARAKKKAEVDPALESLAAPAVAEENPLVPGAVLEPAASAATEPAPEAADEPPVPSMTSPDWTDYVLSLMTSDELVEGNPRVTGLRRVTPLVLGPIVSSLGSPAAARDNGTVVATHYVKVLNRNQLGEFEEEYAIEAQEVGSVNDESCPDANFRRFSDEVASTRAESRALRKLLNLKRIAAEETVAPVEENNGLISAYQVNFIDSLCERNGISVLKYINGGKERYASVEQIPYDRAKNMVAFLSECQRNQAKIKPEWLGYDPDWRSAK